jgi:hypothetical protein
VALGKREQLGRDQVRILCRRKVEMSPVAQSRDDTPLGADTTSATLDRSQTPHWD